MGALTGLLHHMDWLSMLLFVMSGVACLICLTIHELSHGLAAYKLGDPTAKLNGRLTLNPLSHVDWIGLFLLLAVGGKTSFPLFSNGGFSGIIIILRSRHFTALPR